MNDLVDKNQSKELKKEKKSVSNILLKLLDLIGDIALVVLILFSILLGYAMSEVKNNNCENNNIEENYSLRHESKRLSNSVGTAVPNTGYVDTVYFNTLLSNDEVVNLLSQLTFTNNEYIDVPVYGLINKHYWVNNEWVDSTLIVLRMGDSDYAIVNFDTFYVYFSTMIIEGTPEEPSLFTFIGWNPDFNGEIDINGDIENQLQDIPFGNQNNLLTSLFSITPFDGDNPLPDEPVNDGTLIGTLFSSIYQGTIGIIKPFLESVKIGFDGFVFDENGFNNRPVPNTGNINYVYFNKNLSIDEVNGYLANLTYSPLTYEQVGLNQGMYYILSNSEYQLLVTHTSSSDYSILISYGDFSSIPIYVSNLGWVLDSFSFNQSSLISNINDFGVSDVDIIVGDLNYTLTSLVSIDPYYNSPIPSNFSPVESIQGDVGTIYFNTDLNKNDVLDIISNLTFESTPFYDESIYVALLNYEGDKALVFTESGDIAFFDYSTGDIDLVFYDGEWLLNSYDYNADSISDYQGLVIGDKNYYLYGLVSLVPYFKNISGLALFLFVMLGLSVGVGLIWFVFSLLKRGA